MLVNGKSYSSYHKVVYVNFMLTFLSQIVLMLVMITNTKKHNAISKIAKTLIKLTIPVAYHH